MSLRALGLALAIGALCTGMVACGGKHKGAKPGVATPGLPPANPLAVTKMVQGVQAAKEPKGIPRAIDLLKEAIQIDGNLWEARYDLGVLYAQTGALAAAELQLKAAQKIAPSEQDVAVALAEVRRRRGEHKDAADGLEEYVKAFPGAVEARTLYVTTLRDSGQLDKAIQNAREVLVRRPGDPTALSELALCHLAKGERDSAQLLVKQALDGNAKSAPAHRAAGLVALANGDDAAAFQAFQKAAQEDPRDTTSRLNMAAVLTRAGAYAKAEEQYRAILAVAADDAAAMVGLAAVLRAQGDAKNTAKFDQAKQLLEKVLERDPNDVRALFNMGVLLFEFMKRPDEAKTYFDRFLSEAPSDHPQRAEADRYMSQASVQKKAPPPAPAGGAK